MSTNNSSIDTNIDSYSDDELYEILDLDTDASVDEISDRTNELYNRFLSENNYDMAYRFSYLPSITLYLRCSKNINLWV